MRFLSFVFVLAVCLNSVAQEKYWRNGNARDARLGDAPNGPGKVGTWPRPDKDGFGSTLERPVWFTLTGGSVAEIHYPHVDRAQTHGTYLVIKNGSETFDERWNFKHVVTRIPETTVFEVESQSPSIGIKKTIQVSTDHDAVVIDYEIQFNGAGARTIGLIHNPSAESTNGGDAIEVADLSRLGTTLHAQQLDVRGDEPQGLKPMAHQLVSWNLQTDKANTGFEGVNSPLDRPFDSEPVYVRARYGNVAGVLVHNTTSTRVVFRVIVGLSDKTDWKSGLASQIASLMNISKESLISRQRSEWRSYLSRLDYDKRDKLAEASILILKSSEDKRQKGAFIAAPANPNLPWVIEALDQDYEASRKRIGENGNGGYRRVWPRDLYHKALSLLSVGDLKTPLDVARWYKKVQLKTGNKAGSWAQNMWVDGSPSWTSMQLDQVAFPIVLVARLVELKAADYNEFREMVNVATDFITKNGPGTETERWEEIGGLSANSFAAAVEGILAASWLEGQAGNPQRATDLYNLAQSWIGNLKPWLLVKSGHYGSNYFARIEIDKPFNPNRQTYYDLANKREGQQKRFREDEILDGGFLQWILAGIVDPKDSDFSNTIRLYDTRIRKNTPKGAGYFRYNHDSYGENNIAGFWPLLSGERAIAAIERGENPDYHVDVLKNSANNADLIPEQDTLSVRPLAWSHANYLLVQRSLKDRRSFYIPRRNIKRR